VATLAREREPIPDDEANPMTQLWSGESPVPVPSQWVLRNTSATILRTCSSMGAFLHSGGARLAQFNPTRTLGLEALTRSSSQRGPLVHLLYKAKPDGSHRIFSAGAFLRVGKNQP